MSHLLHPGTVAVIFQGTTESISQRTLGGGNKGTALNNTYWDISDATTFDGTTSFSMSRPNDISVSCPTCYVFRTCSALPVIFAVGSTTELAVHLEKSTQNLTEIVPTQMPFTQCVTQNQARLTSGTISLSLARNIEYRFMKISLAASDAFMWFGVGMRNWVKNDV